MGECQFRKNVAEPVFSQAYGFHCWLPVRNSYYVRIAHGKSAHPFTTHMSRSVHSATVIPPSVSGLRTARGCVSSACQPSLSHTYSFYQIPGNPTERNTVFTQFVLFFREITGQCHTNTLCFSARSPIMVHVYFIFWTVCPLQSTRWRDGRMKTYVYGLRAQQSKGTLYTYSHTSY